MRRTTWLRKRSDIFLKPPEPIILRKRKKEECTVQQQLLNRIYPTQLTAAYGFEGASQKSLIKSVVLNVMQNRICYHWAAEYEGQLGFASYYLSPEQFYVNLWIAVPEVNEENFIRALIPAIQLKIEKDIHIDFPEDKRYDSLSEIGMREMHTLIWKRKILP